VLERYDAVLRVVVIRVCPGFKAYFHETGAASLRLRETPPLAAEELIRSLEAELYGWQP
jgi:hypothetical protein